MSAPRKSGFVAGDLGIRAKRIPLREEVVVESRTIGTPMVYCMPMENLSRTGILMAIGRNKKVPFRVNTLLELTVDPRGAHFEHPVNCLGKIVRTQGENSPDARYGVQIVQIEGRDQGAWDKGLMDLESGDIPALPAA